MFSLFSGASDQFRPGGAQEPADLHSDFARVGQAACEACILRELPSRGKTHVFAYDRYMEILNTEEAI